MRACNGNWVAVEVGWSWLLWLRARCLLLIHVESSQPHLRPSETPMNTRITRSLRMNKCWATGSSGVVDPCREPGRAVPPPDRSWTGHLSPEPDRNLKFKNVLP